VAQWQSRPALLRGIIRVVTLRCGRIEFVDSKGRVRPLNWLVLVLALSGMFVALPLHQGIRRFTLLGHTIDRPLVAHSLTGSALLILSLLWITGPRNGILRTAGIIVLTLVLLTVFVLVKTYAK
jgi:hypothetical protein